MKTDRPKPLRNDVVWNVRAPLSLQDQSLCEHSGVLARLSISPWGPLSGFPSVHLNVHIEFDPRNGRERCSGMLHDVITQMVYWSGGVVKSRILYYGRACAVSKRI